MKRLFVLSILLYTTLFYYNVLAQEMGSYRGSIQISIPEKIQEPLGDPLLPGIYTIGAGGDFATIPAVFNKLSNDGVAGEVIFELIDNLYTAPSDSFGFFLNGPIPGTGPNSKVIFKPALNKNVTIEGNGHIVLSLTDVKYLTFDGVSLTGSTTLTIHALINAQYDWSDCLGFWNNSDHNVVQNINFINDDYTRYGSGPVFWTRTNFTVSPDSNLIQNNFIKKASIGMYVSTYNSSARATGNIIRGNIIGSENDSLIIWGIQVEKCSNTIIENNIVQNLKATKTVGEILNPGINSFEGNGDIIRNNIVHNINSSSGYTSVGILLSGQTVYGHDNLVYNNMVYDIRSTSSWGESRVAGIQAWMQVNPKIYYNSVYLTGIGTNHSGSGALYIWNTCGNVDTRNNILINSRDESPYCATSVYVTGYASIINSDYNCLYYVASQYSCLVRTLNGDYHSLAEWQATGKDLNSLNESVNFVSPTDLHINNNYVTLLDGRATPISGLTLDFDGETRNTTSPDIGADEFELSPNASNWQIHNSNFPSDVLVVDFSTVNEQVCWAIGQIYPGNTTPYAGYIRTADGGNNWVCDTIPGVTNSYLQQVFTIDEDTAYITVYKLIGTSGTSRGIYKTTDGGTNWNRQNAYNSSQSGPGIIHFFDSQNGVVIGDPNLETYTTTNGGLTWDPVTMPSALQDEATWLGESRITVIGNTVWFATNRRLFKSTDKGYTWTVLVNQPQYYDWLPSLALQDDLTGIYALKIAGYGTDHIYRKTTDGGATWATLTNSVLDNLAPSCIQHIPGTSSVYIAVGGRTPTMRGTAVSYDAGESWTLIDTLGVFLINFFNNRIGWGSQFGTNVVYNYVGPQIINSVEEEIIDIVPTGYSLSQNYPNPFNPTTTFRYSIPQTSKVVLKVYDILGNEIALLMDEEKSVGTYELTWDAESLPSGVYFYQLRAGEYVNTKKMILLK